MMSDKESLTKQDGSDNFKTESGGNLTLNVDSRVSSESICDNAIETKMKIDKTKIIIENEKVKEKIKKEKNNLIIKVKDDYEKSKEKFKIEKEKMKDESDDVKERKRRLKDKNGNPFLRIIGEMTDEKSDEDKQIENNNLNVSKYTNRRKQNLKNLSSGEKCMKLKLSNDTKKNSDSNSTIDIKKESRPLPPPAPKPKLPESKTILEKKNYSINVEKKEYMGEKKLTVKTFKSKFRSTGLEEAPPPPLSKSKVQSKKTVKNLVSPLSILKTEKRSLSPSSDSPNEKKLKNSSDTKKPPRKILNLYIFLIFVLITVSVLRMDKAIFNLNIFNMILFLLFIQ